jgi:cyclopropane fatty-acyl-phospholipid synthase-like methyltransferase
MNRDRLSLIGHSALSVMNPLPIAAFGRLIELVGLEEGDSAVEIGAGKGAIALLAMARGAKVTLVERSPLFAPLAEKAIAQAKLSALADVVTEDAQAFVARVGTGRFHLAICVGASHALGGRDKALAALAALVVPGGRVMFGEGYWRKPPTPAYAKALGATGDEFGTIAENVAAAQKVGLVPVREELAGPDEFKAYELGWCAALEKFATSHPDDPDAAELRAVAATRRDAYVKWGKDELGFAVHLFAR